jgi:hypothetical protein
MSNSSERAKPGAFLTKYSHADEALAGFRAFHENVQLFGQLVALGVVLLRFTSDAGHEVGGYGSDSNRRKDIMELGDELGFDDFDSDIIDETFQSNLSTYTTRSARGS